MNPNELLCLNPSCPAKGQRGQGNIRPHSQQEQRCICTVCGDTFSTHKGTLFYRAQRAPGTEATVVILVLTLLAYGCPTQAAAIAFGLDERTVKRWWERAGKHCESFHKYMVSSKQLDLQQVQADELKIKWQGDQCWLAVTLMVSTRLWLGGVVAEQRNQALIQQLVGQIKQMARCRPLPLAVDGFAAYVTAFQTAFRSPLPRFGRPGHPTLVAWPNIAIVQVVKQHLHRTGQIARCIVQGATTLVDRLLQATQDGQGSSTPLTLSASMPPCANDCTGSHAALAPSPSRPKPCTPVCLSSAVSTISVMSLRAFGSNSRWANGAFAGSSAPRPWPLT